MLHALTGGKHAMPARHAANGRGRKAVAARAARTLSPVGQRVFRAAHPPQVSKLGGAVIDPDIPTWQLVIRTAQTPAFGIAMIVGLVFAWSGAAAPSSLAAHKLTPHPGHVPTSPGRATNCDGTPDVHLPHPPPRDMRDEDPAGLGLDTTPKIHDEAHKDDPRLPAPQDVPDLQPATDNPDLEAALTVLDQNADRDQAWASQQPGPPVSPVSCSPICTDSNGPESQSELNSPPGIGAR